MKDLGPSPGRARDAMGVAIRRARLGHGLSQTTLGLQSGLDQTTISKLENGHARLRFISLLRVLDTLGIVYIELLDAVPPSPMEAFFDRYAPDGHTEHGP
jgi:transcriptional regulator with XRE-family HTH domain